MAKKTFVRARVVKADRWVIDYHVTNTRSEATVRHRKDFDLNEIEDLQVREAVAVRICRFLESWDFPEISTPGHIAGPALADCVQRALQIKISGPRRNTHKGYKYIVPRFLEWCEAHKLASKPAAEFGRKQARDYFDALRTSRQYTGCTINNYVAHLRALWTELVDAEQVPENPWKSIKRVRVDEKNVRVFTPHERHTVASYIRDNDYWLFRALLLQFYCYIRPVEISRLKFRAFDFQRGLVVLEAHETKKWKKRWATIPASVLPYFTDGVFNQQPGHHFVLGRVGAGKVYQLGASPVAAHESAGYRHHLRHLEHLRRTGHLSTCDGLSWYGWKSTGITLHLKKALLPTRDQAGHEELDTTLIYYEKDEVNQEYRALPDDLFL